MNLRQKLLAAAVLASLASPALSVGLRDAAIGRAQDALRARPALAFAGPGESFTARDVVLDADGSQHVRFERNFAGLPVIGGDFVLHQRLGKEATSSLTLRSVLKPDMRAEIGAADAMLVAMAAFGGEADVMPQADRVI